MVLRWQCRRRCAPAATPLKPLRQNRYGGRAAPQALPPLFFSATSPTPPAAGAAPPQSLSRTFLSVRQAQPFLLRPYRQANCESTAPSPPAPMAVRAPRGRQRETRDTRWRGADCESGRHKRVAGSVTSTPERPKAPRHDISPLVARSQVQEAKTPSAPPSCVANWIFS